MRVVMQKLTAGLLLIGLSLVAAAAIETRNVDDAWRAKADASIASTRRAAQVFRNEGSAAGIAAIDAEVPFPDPMADLPLVRYLDWILRIGLCLAFGGAIGCALEWAFRRRLRLDALR